MYIARVAKPAKGSTLDLWLIENGSQNPKNNTAIAKCASTLNVFLLVFASLFRDVFMAVLLLVNILGRRMVCAGLQRGVHHTSALLLPFPSG